MALDSESASLEEEEELQRQLVHASDDDQDAPSHNPSAPPNELFDISTTVDPSYIISLIRRLLPTSERSNCGVHDDLGDKNDHMEEGEVAVQKMDHGDMDVAHDSDEFSGKGGEGNDVLVGEEAWEEYGCVLWDLAASKDHAELMVQNLILEVLLANLIVSQSVRVTEIILGIIGNLACHEVPMKQIVSTDGLIDLVVEQLFLDDTQGLCEVCRLLTSGLQGSEHIIWAKALGAEHVLCRILWVAENTLNPQLIEKCVGLLLAITESEEGVLSSLLPPLMKLGLPTLLINLLTTEMSKLTSEGLHERYFVLDAILRAIEALSVIDGHSNEICSNKDLFKLVCDLVKLPDKAEVASSCVTAAVLIANILSDAATFASDLSQGKEFMFLMVEFIEGIIAKKHLRYFLFGLLDIFPFASDDVEAKNAIWSIIARLLVRVREDEMSTLNLHHYVSVLVSKYELIEDDLLDHQVDESSRGREKSTSPGKESNATITALRRISCILKRWSALKAHCEEKDVMEKHYVDEQEAKRLLDCCLKHTRVSCRGC